MTMGDQHDEVIHRHLHERVNRVAVGEIAPDEDHRRAGCGGEDDKAGGVCFRQFRGNPPGKNVLHEQPAQKRHAERLDEPVDEQGDEQSPGLFGDAAEGGKIHLEHHGINHKPDEHRDGRVDVRAGDEFQPA